jgi:hypothetical protein
MTNTNNATDIMIKPEEKLDLFDGLWDLNDSAPDCDSNSKLLSGSITTTELTSNENNVSNDKSNELNSWDDVVNLYEAPKLKDNAEKSEKSVVSNTTKVTKTTKLTISTTKHVVLNKSNANKQTQNKKKVLAKKVIQYNNNDYDYDYDGEYDDSYDNYYGKY